MTKMRGEMVDCCILYGARVYLEESEAEVLGFTGIFVREGAQFGG